MIRVGRKEHVDEWKQYDNHTNRAQPAFVSIVPQMQRCRRPQPAVFFFSDRPQHDGRLLLYFDTQQ